MTKFFPFWAGDPCLGHLTVHTMNIISLIPFALGLVASFSAAEDKHHAHPCNRCTKEEAIKKALALQAQIVASAQQCDIKSALELCLPNGSYSTIDQFCADGTCCNSKGSLEEWWTFYQCTDTTYYPVQPTSVEHLKNGTVIISLPEVGNTYLPDWQRKLIAYSERWFWMPVQSADGCDFRLGYIDGHSYNCPAFIPNAIACENPVCVGVN